MELKLLYTLSYEYASTLFGLMMGNIFFILYVNIHLVLENTIKLSSKVTVIFYITTISEWTFYYPTTLSVFVVPAVTDFVHSNSHIKLSSDYFD